MTPEQRAALDALPPKRREFVLTYVETGNATEAARRAKYAKPRQQGARLLTFVDVRRAVDALRIPREDARVMGIDELRALWSRWAREGTMERTVNGARVVTPLEDRDMIKASELLGKSRGAFIDRVEHSGPAGGAIGVTIVGTREDVVAAARENGGTGG